MADAAAKPPRSRLWQLLAAPGMLWLFALFVAPLYVVLCVVFGRIDPIFRTTQPVWNPLHWDRTEFTYVFTHIFGSNAVFGSAIWRTAAYVLSASLLCLLIAFPVAYYTARLAGRRRGILLAALIAPFWISYMMRMLAWVNLLQNDGIVNRIVGAGGLFPDHYNWLGGHATVVVLGLVYGYVPYMVLPLYAGLDRLPRSSMEAARDLGASRWSAFWRVTLPLCRPTLIAAVLLTTLPMLGDYFTVDILSASPRNSMVGNLINNTVLTPGQTGQAGAFVLLVLIVAIIPMLLYVRATRRAEAAAT
ncbi:MAG TPA: ABC transporter permease [Kribbella sp.]